VAKVARTRASSPVAWPSEWQEHQVSPVQDVADIQNEDLPDLPKANKNRTESHEQLFFACNLGTTDEREYGDRWNQLLC
jgi:hypothetical protein